MSRTFPLQVVSIIFALVGLISSQSCVVASDIVTTSATLAKGIVFTTQIKPFNCAEHDISLCKGNGSCIIDGVRAYGSPGVLPKNEFVSIILKINNHDIPLESKGMYNGW